MPTNSNPSGIFPISDSYIFLNNISSVIPSTKITLLEKNIFSLLVALITLKFFLKSLSSSCNKSLILIHLLNPFSL